MVDEVIENLVQAQRVLGSVLGLGVLYPRHGQLGVGGEEVGEDAGRLPPRVGQLPMRGQLEPGDQPHQGLASRPAHPVVRVREEGEDDPVEHRAGEGRVDGRERGELQGGEGLEQLDLGEPVRAGAQGEDRAQEGDGLLWGGGGGHGGEAHLEGLTQGLQDHRGVVPRHPPNQLAGLLDEGAAGGHLPPRPT